MAGLRAYQGSSSDFDDLFNGVEKYFENTQYLDTNAGFYADTLSGSGFTLNNLGSLAPTTNISDLRQDVIAKAEYTDTVKLKIAALAGLIDDLIAFDENGALIPLLPSDILKLAKEGIMLTNNGQPVVIPDYTSVNILIENNLPKPNTNGNNIDLFTYSDNQDSQYLVQTNDLYTSAGDNNNLGTLLFEQHGIVDAQDKLRRLGDARYEAYLVEEQIKKLGNGKQKNIFNGANANEQLQQLVENAISQADDLGLEYGKEPSLEQLANIKEDIVWMVIQEINGEKVLVPKVYLSADTIAMFEDTPAESGITANNIMLENLDGVNNIGGNITAKERLSIEASGDINNISGTIKGDVVSVASTQGSINNETITYLTGSDKLSDML